jgi:hypothetical protein
MLPGDLVSTHELLPCSFRPWPVDDLSRLRAGVFALAQNLNAIDEHIANSSCILMRLLERRMVLNVGGIEDYDIGEVARLERAAAVELEVLGGERTQLPYGCLQRNQLLIADILAQQPGDVVIRAWVGVGFQEDPFRRQRGFV